MALVCFIILVLGVELKLILLSGLILTLPKVKEMQDIYVDSKGKCPLALSRKVKSFVFIQMFVLSIRKVKKIY